MHDVHEEKQVQNKLAVFEHIACKEKKSNNKNNSSKRGSKRSQSPTSENDLVIDDDDSSNPPKKRNVGVRLLEEPLAMRCDWTNCEQNFDDYRKFIFHLKEHVENFYIHVKICKCQWCNCNYSAPTKAILNQHICYHGYHTKLKNIGENVLQRVTDLPKCTQTSQHVFPVSSNGYSCNWEDCDVILPDIYEFHEHIRLHVNSNPKYCKSNEVITCLWQGCNYKCTSQYKLSDHVKTHTKEKVVACPSCGTMFAAKTKFYDHRIRQLPVEVQNYQCSECTKFFPSERLLRDHMRSHINHYKCTMCDMTCPKPSALATHIRYRHLSERPLKCNFCSQMCVTKQALDAHLLTHCSEKFLKCDCCDFRCRSLYGLDKHLQNFHGVDWTQTYGCHCCHAKFQRGNYLTKHLIKAHKYRWPSGHSRFKYKQEADGIFRLQLVRYESIEVTQEMMRTNNTTQQVEVETNRRYNLRKRQQSSDKTPNYVLMVDENGEQNVVCPTSNNIVMTINDVDESGNILNSEILQSKEMKIMGSSNSSEKVTT